MSEPLYSFISILNENKISPRQRDIPEDIDNKEELLKELEQYRAENEQLPDSCFDFAINGYTSPVELEDFLEQEFDKFKIVFLASDNGEAFKKEVLKQLEKASTDLNPLIEFANTIDDLSLKELLRVKLRHIEQTIEFLKQIQSTVKNSSAEQKKEIHSYKWLKEDASLVTLYEQMISNELISKDTEQEDFIAIFSHLPLSEISNPIHWEKGPKLFTYFFHELTERKLIPNTPKWVNLKHFFTYYDKESGMVVPTSENIKQHVTEIKNLGAPKESDTIDSILAVVDNHN